MIHLITAYAELPLKGKPFRLPCAKGAPPRAVRDCLFLFLNIPVGAVDGVVGGVGVPTTIFFASV